MLRVQVKATMKATSSAARVLQRILNARQFGLKMIANVSYGYTAAGFSGRMPFAELADSIVQVSIVKRGAVNKDSSLKCAASRPRDLTIQVGVVNSSVGSSSMSSIC